MIEGESILCFAPERWQHIWRNRHQIMSRLAQRNRVLFVEPRPYLRNVWRDARRGKIRPSDLRQPLVTQVQDTLWVYHPPLYAPISGRFPLAAALRWLRATEMRRVMRRLGFSAPILWLYRPYMADVIGRFGEKLVIYHIVDEYAAYEAEFTAVYSDARRDQVEKAERALAAQADLVIVTSPSLLERKRAFNPNTHWVPNAVDYATFARVAEENPPPPADVASLPMPVIGYVGAINEKLDYDLLRQVAEAYPQSSLILVGPVDLRLDFSGLQKISLPNVHLLGAKPVTEVPHYVHACQVCLMPYKRNEWTAHINPLKLYEYLASGRPVVSTAIPAVHGYEGVIAVADSPESFCQQIGVALASEDAEARRARMALAAQNTWDVRVARISELVNLTLLHKGM